MGKKLRFLVLLLLLMFCTCVPAFASNSFSVTVPTALPVSVSANGTVTTANDCKIRNEGSSAVELVKVNVQSQNGWTLDEMTKDYGAIKVGEKTFGMSVFDNNINADGTSATPNVGTITPKAEKDIKYSAKVAAQAGSVTDTIASVVLTFNEVAPLDFTITASNRGEVGFTNATTNLEIPETFTGSDGKWYRVVGIDTNAFANCDKLASVTIPKTVSNIKTKAFDNCPNLADIIFGHSNSDSIVIGANAFYVKDFVKTNIVSQNDTVNKYDWAGDHRRSSEPIMQSWDYDLSSDFHKFSDTVTSITFEKIYIEPISPTHGPWDVSENKDGSVMAYMDGTDVFICSNVGKPVKVIANTDSSAAFTEMTAMTSFDATNLDTSRVANMSDMFANCYSLTSIDVSSFNTSKVTDMGGMFAACYSLPSLDLSKFDTINVVSMRDMFFACSELVSIDISSFNTSKVTDMCDMFFGCSSLASIDVHNFDTKSITDSRNLETFAADCSNLSTITLGPNFGQKGNTPAAGDVSGMFYYKGTPNKPTTVIGTNDVMKAYDWVADKRAVTFPSDSSKYTISFNANTGNGAMDTITSYIGVPVSLPTCTFNKEGYIFAGWSDTPKGTVKYTDGSAVDSLASTASANVTLYAIWKADTSRLLKNIEFVDKSTDRMWTTGQFFEELYCPKLNYQLLNHNSDAVDVRQVLTVSAFAYDSPHKPKTVAIDDRAVEPHDDTINGSLSGGNEVGRVTLDTSTTATHNYKDITLNGTSESITGAVSGDYNIDYQAYLSDYGIGAGCKTTLAIQIKPHTGSTDADWVDLYTKEISLDAQKTYTVTFNPTYGFLADPLDDTREYANNRLVTIPGSLSDRSYLRRPGYVFKGWSLTEDGDVDFYPGTGYFVISPDNTDRTLYAVWGEKSDPVMQSWGSSSTTDFHQYRNTITSVTFKDTYSLPTNVTQGPWDVSARKDGTVMAYMQGTDVFICSNIDTPAKVRANPTSSYLFYNFVSLANIDARHLDASNVEELHCTFLGCSKLQNIDSNFFTSTIIDSIYRTFDGCTSLKAVDFTRLNGCNIIGIEGAFSECSSLERIYVSGDFVLSNLRNYSEGTFENCNSLVGGNGTRYSPENDSPLYACIDKPGQPGYFTDSEKPIMQSWLSADTSDFHKYKSSVTSITFKDSYTLPSGVTAGPWDISEAKNGTVMAYMINNDVFICSNVGRKANVVANTDSSWMFSDFSSLNKFDCTYLDTSSVNDMSYMFSNCSSLVTLDLNTFNTENVVNTTSMFSDCSALINLNIDTWNTQRISNMYRMFLRCRNLLELDLSNWDAQNLTDTVYMFSGCSKLVTIYATDAFDLSVRSMYGMDMFLGCHSLVGGNSTKYTSSKMDNEYARIDKQGQPGYFTLKVAPKQPIMARFHAAIDTDAFYEHKNNVTKVTFKDTYEIPSNVSHGPWDISDAKDESVMAYMVGSEVFVCSNVNKPAKVIANKDLSYMFYNFPKLEVVDASQLDTSGVHTLLCMFQGCSNLQEVNTTGWDTKNVESIKGIFFGCSNLLQFDAEHWNTSKLTDMEAAFTNCAKLHTAKMASWDTSHVLTMGGLFGDCPSLSFVDVSKWNTESVRNMSHMFNNCSSLTSLDVSGWNTSNVTNLYNMFRCCSNIERLNVSNWNTGAVTNMQGVFKDCSKITTLDVSRWDTRNVKDMVRMFQNCSELKTLDVSSWNTQSLEDISAMFQGCQKLSTLDVADWNTSNMVSMAATFDLCTSLTTLDVSNWDTHNVVTLKGTFANCTSLPVLDVHKWVTSSVTNMDGTFSNCASLTSIDASNWDTSKVTNMANMFDSCDSLTNLNISSFDTRSVTDSKYLNRFASFCDKLENITLGPNFGQEGKIPNAGYVNETTAGMFFIDQTHAKTTSVTGANGVMKGYKWGSDHRAVTFKEPVNIPANITFTDNSTAKSWDTGVLPRVDAIDMYDLDYTVSNTNEAAVDVKQVVKIQLYDANGAIPASQVRDLIARAPDMSNYLCDLHTNDGKISTDNYIEHVFPVFTLNGTKEQIPSASDGISSLLWQPYFSDNTLGYGVRITIETQVKPHTGTTDSDWISLDSKETYLPYAPNYTVRLDPNGGNGSVREITTCKDHSFTVSGGSSLTRPGYELLGWSETSTGSVKYKDGQTYSNISPNETDITLYACWEQTVPTETYWEFTKDGTFTVPATGTYTIEMHGGGGGGGASYTDDPSGSGGGGGGSGELYTVKLTKGDSYAVKIGRGGDAGYGNDKYGSRGGSTTFGSLLSLKGGDGGEPPTDSYECAKGGTGSGSLASNGHDGFLDGEFIERTPGGPGGSGGSTKGFYGRGGNGAPFDWNSSKFANDGNDGAVFVTWKNPLSVSTLNIDTNFDVEVSADRLLETCREPYGEFEQGEIVDLTDIAKTMYRDGYTFLGFNIDPNAECGGYQFVMGDTDSTLYAIWEKIDRMDNISWDDTETRYDVNVYLNGGYIGNGVDAFNFGQFAVDETVDLLYLKEHVYRNGYMLTGFSTEPNAVSSSFIHTMPNETLTLYAIWVPVVQCLCASVDGTHLEGCPMYVPPAAPQCLCGTLTGNHIEGCPLYVPSGEPNNVPDVEPQCNCGSFIGDHAETCPLYVPSVEPSRPNEPQCDCGSFIGDHAETCPLYAPSEEPNETPNEEPNEPQCNCGSFIGDHAETCPLYVPVEEPNEEPSETPNEDQQVVPECTCGSIDGIHLEGCSLFVPSIPIEETPDIQLDLVPDEVADIPRQNKPEDEVVEVVYQ